MNEDYFKPIWIKAILGFALMMTGLLFIFLVFRFFPIPKQTGFDALNAVLLSLYVLGGIEVLYIIGMLIQKNHPYRVFTSCLVLFTGILVLIRCML